MAESERKGSEKYEQKSDPRTYEKEMSLRSSFDTSRIDLPNTIGQNELFNTRSVEIQTGASSECIFLRISNQAKAKGVRQASRKEFDRICGNYGWNKTCLWPIEIDTKKDLAKVANGASYCAKDWYGATWMQCRGLLVDEANKQ